MPRHESAGLVAYAGGGAFAPVAHMGTGGDVAFAHVAHMLPRRGSVLALLTMRCRGMRALDWWRMRVAVPLRPLPIFPPVIHALVRKLSDALISMQGR